MDRREMDAIYLYGLVHGLRVPLRVALEIREANPVPTAARPTTSEALAIRDRAVGIAPTRRRRTASEEWWEAAESTIREHLEAGLVAVPFTDADYPPLLRGIPDPPAVLFVRGDLAALRGAVAVAIVGTRKSTPSGEAAAREIVGHFASEGYTIVAGLAIGIDTVVHEAALEARGRTVAVLPGGLDRVYPEENLLLADRIASSGGALVTEYPLGMGVRDWTFVQRDRIQSGMSVAVIPVQTGLEGGTMHTVAAAERQGRPLFCPEPPANATECAGVRKLLRAGRARPLTGDWRSELRELLPRHRRRLLEQTP